jgi:hypothetical protein
MTAGGAALGVGVRMRVIYEYPGGGPRFPYLVLQDVDGTYYKVRRQGRFLFVSQGSVVTERTGGEVDIPYVGADRVPIGDLVYASEAEAQAALDRFRRAPSKAVAMVLTGQKP